jgi:hypothetical protein
VAATVAAAEGPRRRPVLLPGDGTAPGAAAEKKVTAVGTSAVGDDDGRRDRTATGLRRREGVATRAPA